MQNLEEKEEWRDIEGYENYQVSNLGRVKSLKFGKERILKPSKRRDGYLMVNLSKQGKGKGFLIHRLVAQAFIPNPLNLPQVNHINEDKTDNRAKENLEYCSAEYNNNYGSHNERVAKANTNGKLSKSVKQYSLKGEFLREFPSTIEVQRQLGFAYTHICECCNNKRKTAYNYIWRYAE